MFGTKFVRVFRTFTSNNIALKSNSRLFQFQNRIYSFWPGIISGSKWNFSSKIEKENQDDLFDESEQAAMAEAKQIFNEIEEAVIELKSYADWVPTVMKSKIPVILDWYADWCNPCQQLTPILETKAIESNGQFKLVKINIDILPEISNGLKVRSIPAVFLVSGGNVMDTLVGMPSEERLNDFINTAKLLDNLSHDMKTIDSVIYAAEEHLNNQDYFTALEVFKSTEKTASMTEEQNSLVLLYIAFCYLKLDQENNGKEYFIKWQNKHRHDTHESKVQDLLYKYEQAIDELRENQGQDEILTELENKLEQNPEDIQTMYDLAEHLKEKEMYEEAIDYCIDIIAIDRNWNSSASHKLLLDMFNKLGTNSEIVKEGRKKLSKVLF